MISRRKSSSLALERDKTTCCGSSSLFFKSDTLEFYCVQMIAPANEWHHREERVVGRMPCAWLRAERAPHHFCRHSQALVAGGKRTLHVISHAPLDSVIFKSIPFACMADGQMQSMSFSVTQILL
jgi:hypothetical protein